MRILTDRAALVCDHALGRVANRASQHLVRIDGSPVLVDDDPEGRTISGCPNRSAAIKPCQLTLRVREGYSALLRIDGRRVCLDSVRGLTDGTPPGTVDYHVEEPGQALARSGS